jgi:hypothetical protein
MRLVLIAVVALLAAGCGAATDVRGSSGRSPTLAQPTESTEVEEPDVKPPAIFLVSAAGKQKAVQGSSCVQYVNPDTGEGTGVCADSAVPHPPSVTSVAAGDRVTFIIDGASVKKDSTVTIRPLGCGDPEVDELAFEPGPGGLEWTVDLDHGAYQLDVFAVFETDDGRSGDVSGTLGLTVAGPKKWDALGIRAVEPDMKVCPFGE